MNKYIWIAETTELCNCIIIQQIDATNPMDVKIKLIIILTHDFLRQDSMDALKRERGRAERVLREEMSPSLVTSSVA